MNERLLNRLQPDNLRTLVTAALAQPESIDAYRHANGFDKLTLATTRQGVVVRAHLWHRSQTSERAELDGATSAHNHRWDFCSRVLSGAIKIRTFAPVPGDGPYYHYQYSPGQQDEMRLIGPAALVLSNEATYETGDCYDQPRDTVHVAEQLDSGPLVTAIAHSASQRSYADVYTSSTSPRVGDRSERLPTEDILAQLTALSRLLAPELSRKLWGNG